jgi:hypothetical protein
MPTNQEWQDAVNWALQQEGVVLAGNYIDRNGLVDNVRCYFINNDIECPPMAFSDPEPYIPKDYKY